MDSAQEDASLLRDAVVSGRENLDLETARSSWDTPDHLIECHGNASTSGRGSRGMKRIGTSTCDHWCADDAEFLNPDLWSALPKELLLPIFARLPLPQIMRLRGLSKEWMRNVTTPGGAFRRACAEASPKMFGLIHQRHVNDDNTFGVAVYNFACNEWYKFAIETTYANHSFITMGASDGGLVCIISRVRDERFRGPLLIIVCNPLTRQWKALPPHVLSPVQPLMVQLVMNRHTKAYEVILVYCTNEPRGAGDVEVKLYSSATGEWRSAGSRSSGTTFLGYQYAWDFDNDSDLLDFYRLSPCLYDSAGFQTLDSVEGVSVRGYALVEDRLFVLHRERDTPGEVGPPRGCFILEYRRQKAKPNWVSLKKHSLMDLGKYCSHRGHSECVELFGCKGFLFVTSSWDSCGVAQVYDLSEGKWHVIPDIVWEGPVVCDGGMCELQWDAIP